MTPVAWFAAGFFMGAGAYSLLSELRDYLRERYGYVRQPDGTWRPPEEK